MYSSSHVFLFTNSHFFLFALHSAFMLFDEIQNTNLFHKFGMLTTEIGVDANLAADSLMNSNQSIM